MNYDNKIVIIMAKAGKGLSTKLKENIVSGTMVITNNLNLINENKHNVINIYTNILDLQSLLKIIEHAENNKEINTIVLDKLNGFNYFELDIIFSKMRISRLNFYIGIQLSADINTKDLIDENILNISSFDYRKFVDQFFVVDDFRLKEVI